MPNTGDYVRATDFDELKPQLSIGTVTTGAAGTNASASVTGTTPNFKLNLTIPRGNTGATGPAGPSGTFTGPLKPTNSYWRGPVSVYVRSGQYGTNYYAIYVPSGGTWAIYVPNHANSTYLGTKTVSGLNEAIPNNIKIVSGGTRLSEEFMENNSSLKAMTMWSICWRIQ